MIRPTAVFNYDKASRINKLYSVGTMLGFVASAQFRGPMKRYGDFTFHALTETSFLGRLRLAADVPAPIKSILKERPPARFALGPFVSSPRFGSASRFRVVLVRGPRRLMRYSCGHQ